MSDSRLWLNIWWVLYFCRINIAILSNLNGMTMLILMDDVINNKDDIPFIASVYHAIYVAARNIDNADLT